MLRALLFVVLSLTLGSTAHSQQPDGSSDFAALDAKLRFRLGDDGQILMWPNPADGGATERFTPLVAPFARSTLENAGLAGWLSMLLWGNSDLASMADADAILGRLGRSDDASLYRAIADPSGPENHDKLLRLLAMRAAQQRGLKPAIGPLLKALAEENADADVRQVARETLAALRDEPVRTARPALLPLADVLAQAPAGVDVLLCVEHARMPPSRALLQWGRVAGISLTRRHIARAGGTVSLATWAGAVMLSERFGAVPYEVARRFGNHRPARLVLSLSGIAEPDGPRVFCQLDGDFDVERLRQGMHELGLDTGDTQHVTIALGDETSLTVEPHRAILRSLGRIGQQTDSDAGTLANELAADDAPVALWLRTDLQVPAPESEAAAEVAELSQTVTRLGLRRLALWPPRAPEQRLTLRATCASDAKARVVAAELEMMRDDITRRIAGAGAGEALEPLIALLKDMRLENEGAHVTASISCTEIDPLRTLQALVDIGLR